MTDTLKIAITGASGMLGTALLDYLSDDYSIFATSRTLGYCKPRVQWQLFDLLDQAKLVDWLTTTRPDVVIHCAAIVNVDACENEPDKAEALHVGATTTLINTVAKWDGRIIYISTDSVYDGSQYDLHHEEEKTNPLNVYARTKLAGGLRVLDYSGGTLLRTSIFGWSQTDRYSFAEWILKGLIERTPLTMFTDVFFTPIHVTHAAQAIAKIIKENLRGLFHLAGNSKLSKYEFAIKMAKIFGLAIDPIIPVSIDSVGLVAERPKNMALSNKKLSKILNYQLPTVDEGLTYLKTQYDNGWLAQIKGRAVSPDYRFWELKQEEILPLAIRGGKPVRAKMLPYGRQSIDEEDIRVVLETLNSDWLTTGPRVAEFETLFAESVGADHAIAVNNGTAALHAAMFAAGITEESEVITTPFTFVATANAARYLGATVKFADIRPDTYNIDPKKIEALITNKTRAIIAVDFAGHPADFDEINALAKRYNLTVIEDAAHALGAVYKNRKVGSLTDLTTFSFHPVKHITTGEGGMITTNNSELAARMRMFRNHGIAKDHKEREALGSWFYDMTELGFNYRLTDIQCALGSSQLKKLDSWVKRRREISARYNAVLGGMPEIIVPATSSETESSWHLYIVQFTFDQLSASRDQIYQALRAENIGVNVHYIPVPWHTYYQKLGYKKGQWPITEAIYEKIISLPMWPGMSDQDVDDVIFAIKKVIKAYCK